VLQWKSLFFSFLLAFIFYVLLPQSLKAPQGTWSLLGKTIEMTLSTAVFCALQAKGGGTDARQACIVDYMPLAPRLVPSRVLVSPPVNKGNHVMNEGLWYLCFDAQWTCLATFVDETCPIGPAGVKATTLGHLEAESLAFLKGEIWNETKPVDCPHVARSHEARLSLTLLVRFHGWNWAYNHLIVSELWPILITSKSVGTYTSIIRLIGTFPPFFQLLMLPCLGSLSSFPITLLPDGVAKGQRIASISHIRAKLETFLQGPTTWFSSLPPDASIDLPRGS
jgi:hypothetical protein